MVLNIFFMNSYIKKISCLIVVVFLNASFGKESNVLSLLDIHKLRSAKLRTTRLFYGKKILIKRHKNLFLINSATDMANRIGCDPSMKTSAQVALKGQHKKIISYVCETKNRER